ncbi:MAG: hypothetical protein Q8R06_13350 [Polaromonas sp.]|uniref:hypothetical protein n=1 Tax=Polaromonas sp. TaxID=1869339 RepID=UPI0027361519|nr:hypothetical protein [Polaromonas sp.]MDP3798111.1 hypothetical protein [Polaromonas sp.]
MDESDHDRHAPSFWRRPAGMAVATAAPSSPTDLKDPVCGMTVTRQLPHRLEHEGRPYYFNKERS